MGRLRPARYTRLTLRRLVQIALGADHGGFELKEQLKSYLRQQGHSIRDLGTNSKDPVDYPKIARDVAELVSAGTARFGIMVDGAGIGSGMTGKKVPRGPGARGL